MFLYVLYKFEMPLAEIVLCQTKSIMSSFELESGWSCLGAWRL